MNMQTSATAIASAGTVTVEDLPPTARFSLRVRSEDVGPIGDALGLPLPRTIGDRRQAGERHAVCLGPDEWLLTAPDEHEGEIIAALDAIRGSHPHALANISDRDVSCRISGDHALTLLAMGCPRDLSQLGVGRAVRTVFDGVGVIVWREGESTFRLDAWRSFMPYVRELLETGMRELRAGL